MITTAEQIDSFKCRVLECGACAVPRTGRVPTIVMKVEHTDFHHAGKKVEVCIDRDDALELATELLIAIRDQLDAENGTYTNGGF